MKLDDREALAMRGDMSVHAHSKRMVAARMALGMSQAEFSTAAGLKQNAINNMERARQRPNMEVMRYLYRAHRIDFNFMWHGEFSQLPGDVQSALFDALERLGEGQTPS